MMKKKKQQGLERLRAEHHRFQHEISHIRSPSCSEHQHHRSSSNSSTDNNDGDDAVWDSIESLKQVCKESNKTAAAAASNLVETWDCSPRSVEVSCQATETECSSTGGKIRITATTLFTANKGHLFVDGNTGSTPKATVDIPHVTSPTTEATPREAINNDNGVVHLPEGELVLASSALNIHIRDAGVSSSNPAHGSSAPQSFSKPVNSQNLSHLGNRSTRTAAATRRLTSKIKNILERLDKGASFQSPVLEAFGGLRNESTGLAEAESYLQDVVSALSSGGRLNRQAVEDNPPEQQELFHGSASEGVNGLNAPDVHNLQDIQPQLPTKELRKEVSGGDAFPDANRMETVPEGGQLNTRFFSSEASVPEVPHSATEVREKRTESPVVKFASKEAQCSFPNDTLSGRCTNASKEAQCSLKNDTLSGRCTNATRETQCSLQVVVNDTSSDRCTNASKDVQCSLQADAVVDSQNDNASKGARKYVPDTKLKEVKPSFPLNFKCKANMEGQGDYAEKLIKRRERENNEFLQRCREKVGQLLEGCRILEAGGENLNHVHIPFENREGKPMDLLHGHAPKGKKDKKLAIKHSVSPAIDIHTMLRDEHTLSSKGHSFHTTLDKLKQKVNAPTTSSGWQALDVRLECAKSAVRNMAGGAFDYDQIYADLGALGDERMKIEQLEMSQRQHRPFSETELQINQVITEELGNPDRLDGKASEQKGAGGKRRRATRSPAREPGSKLLRSKLGKIQPILLDFDRNKDHFGSLLRSQKWDNTATSTQSKVKRSGKSKPSYVGPQQKSDRSALHEKKVPAWVERMTQKPKFDIFEQLEKEKPDKYSFLGALKRRSVRPPGSIFKVGKPINWLPESLSDTKSMAGQGPMQKKKKMFSAADGQDKLKKENEHRDYKSQARYFESSSVEGEKQRSQNDVHSYLDTGDFPSTSNTLNPFNASKLKTAGGGRREHDIESGNSAQDTVLSGASKNFKAKGKKVATQKAINIQDSEGGKAGWVVVGDFCISELNRKGTQVKSGQKKETSKLLELPKTLPSPSDLPCTSHGSPFQRTRVEESGSRTPVARAIVQTVDPSSIAGPSERIHIDESCKKHLEDELLKRSLLEVLLKSMLDESQAEVDHFATEPVNRIRQDERPRPVTTSTQVNDNGPMLLCTRPALKERESSDVECQTQLLASTSEAGRYKQPLRRALTRTMAFKERESSDMESQTELLASNSETREDKQPSLELPTAESSQAVSDTPYVRRSPAAIQGTSRRQHGQVSDGSNQRLGLLSLLPVPFPIMFPVHLNNLRTDHQSTVPVQASPSRVDCAIQTTGQLPQDTRISTGLDTGQQKEIQTAFEPSSSSSPTTPSTPISSPEHEAMIQAALAPLSTTVPSRSNVILLFSDSAGQGSRQTATSDVRVVPSKQLRKGKQHADIHRSNEGSEIELIQDIEERHLGSPKTSRDALHVEHIQPSAMKQRLVPASGTDELLLDTRAREHPFPRTTLHMDDIQPASTSNFVLSGDGGERAGLVARDHALRQQGLKLEDTQPTSTTATDVRRQPADISVKFKEERYSPGFNARGYLAGEEMSQEKLKLKEEDLVNSSLHIQELEPDGEMKSVWGFEETEVVVGNHGSQPYGSPHNDSSCQTDGLVVLDSKVGATKDLDRESKFEGTENTQYFSVDGEISREASDVSFKGHAAFKPSTSNNAKKHFLADHSSKQIQDDNTGPLWHSRRLKMHLEHGPKGRYPVLFGRHVVPSKNMKMLAELERKAAAVLKGRDFRTLQTGRALREKGVYRSHISSEESADYSTHSSTLSSDEVKFKGIQSRLMLDSAECTSSSDGACSSSGSYSNSLIDLAKEARSRQLSEGEVDLGLIEAEELSEGEAPLSLGFLAKVRH